LKGHKVEVLSPFFYSKKKMSNVFLYTFDFIEGDVKSSDALIMLNHSIASVCRATPPSMADHCQICIYTTAHVKQLEARITLPTSGAPRVTVVHYEPEKFGQSVWANSKDVIFRCIGHARVYILPALMAVAVPPTVLIYLDADTIVHGIDWSELASSMHQQQQNLSRIVGYTRIADGACVQSAAVPAHRRTQHASDIYPACLAGCVLVDRAVTDNGVEIYISIGGNNELRARMLKRQSVYEAMMSHAPSHLCDMLSFSVICDKDSILEMGWAFHTNNKTIMGQMFDIEHYFIEKTRNVWQRKLIL